MGVWVSASGYGFQRREGSQWVPIAASIIFWYLTSFGTMVMNKWILSL